MPFTPFSKATQVGKAPKVGAIQKVADKAAAKPAYGGKGSPPAAKATKTKGKKAPPFGKKAK